MDSLNSYRPQNLNTALHLVPVGSAFTAPMLPADVRPREYTEAAVRAVNVAVALIGIVVTSPLMAILALLVKLTSPGPVLYSQTRVGVDRRYKRDDADDRRVHDYGGKLFEMYKFRSMVTDSEADGRAVWAEPRDPRVTPVGRVLRKVRLDELPQLYNVLRGDMNVVGPRPERPSIFAELRKTIPEYQMRQRVRPGITGWAQVNQSYDANIDDVKQKVAYDLEYIGRQSVSEDLRIMLKTLPVMLFGRGAW
ncbi:MAG TPA: sugar transferase [Gemmatimonadaceae bacterium]